MSNKKPEDKVRLACISALENWKYRGVVIDYDDVSNLGRKSTRYGWVMHTKKGKRDIIALFRVGNLLWVYLIECKAPDGGVWAQDQKDYSLKFIEMSNVVYEVVKDASQINIMIEKITGCQQDIIDGITL